jgi:hypothetical protein
MDHSEFPAGFFQSLQPGNDWFFSGSSILDFDDVLPKKIKNPIRHLQDLCMRIMTNGDKDPMAGPLLVAIIPTLSPDLSVSIQCRRVIVKCTAANSQLYEVWAAEIASLITAKEVHQKMWARVWRDLALLPREVTVGSIGSIWEAKPEMSGPFLLILAFFSR